MWNRSSIRRAALAMISVAVVVPSAAAAKDSDYENCVRTWPRDGEIMRGSGRVVRQSRQTASFTRINADGPTDIEVVIGPRFAVEVEADDNILDHVTTEVFGSRLRIGTEGSFCMSRTPRVRITMPAVTAIDIRASGDAQIVGLAGGNLDVTITGSGDVVASGRLEDIDVVVNGSGEVALNDLRADHVFATVNGSGDVEVGEPRFVSATVNGSGAIYYSGNPEFLSQAVHGTGRIRRR